MNVNQTTLNIQGQYHYNSIFIKQQTLKLKLVMHYMMDVVAFISRNVHISFVKGHLKFLISLESVTEMALQIRAMQNQVAIMIALTCYIAVNSACSKFFIRYFEIF